MAVPSIDFFYRELSILLLVKTLFLPYLCTFYDTELNDFFISKI